MANLFTNAVREATDVSHTTNGAYAHKSTKSDLLDMFSCLGALRSRIGDVDDMFARAFRENPELATKMAFYGRDIRGGLQERAVPRMIFRWLAIHEPVTMKANMKYISEYGRYDDLYEFVGTPCENYMWNEVFIPQFKQDMKNYRAGKPISLLAKWAKSTNTSSKESCRLGRLTAEKLGMTTKQYQKTLSLLREYIRVPEHLMSADRWGEIPYENVPSNAMTKYCHAFGRHDYERFNEYINRVKSGEKKINASTLFPYDIVHKYSVGSLWSWRVSGEGKNDVLEAQWKALPNYLDGENNVLVMADTSGSMYGEPIEVALSLAIYFAERNKGDWHNLFMTFESNPHWVELRDGSLINNLGIAYKADWGGSTSLDAAFNLVLDTAIKNHVEAKDMPKAIVVITDMGINVCCHGNNKTIVDTMKLKYAAHGYELPNIVFWTVGRFGGDAYQNRYNTENVQCFSGAAASTFRSVMEAIGMNSYEAMLKTLNNKRYEPIHYVAA